MDLPITDLDRSIVPTPSEIAAALPSIALPSDGTQEWTKRRLRDATIELLFDCGGGGSFYSIHFLVGTPDGESKTQYLAARSAPSVIEDLVEQELSGAGADRPFAGLKRSQKRHPDLFQWGDDSALVEESGDDVGLSAYGWKPGRYASVAIRSKSARIVGDLRAVAVLLRRTFKRLETY